MSGESNGGGGYQQDNSVQLEQMKEAEAQRQQAAADAKKVQDKADFQDALSKAVSGAHSTGTNVLTQRGLDPTKYSDVIDQIISDTQNKVPQLDPNPNQYFTSDVFNAGLNNQQDLVRTQNSTKVKSAFAPGFESSYIPDSSYQSTIDDILSGQAKDAEQQLQYNRQRGTINDQGYQTAEQKLVAARSAGAASLKDIGDSVLAKGRQTISGDANNASSAASTWDLGSPDFDVSTFKSKAQQDADSFNQNLGGSIRNAVGSTNYFDIPGILTAAGIAQGPQNLTTNAPNSAAGPIEAKKNNTNRGLGSTGQF